MPSKFPFGIPSYFFSDPLEFLELLDNPSTDSHCCTCFMLDLKTGKIIRSAVSSEAFAVIPLEIQSWTPHPCIWNTKLCHPYAFRIPVQETPRQNSKMSLMVWYGNFLETAMDLVKHCWTHMLSEPWRSWGLLKLMMRMMMFRIVF